MNFVEAFAKTFIAQGKREWQGGRQACTAPRTYSNRRSTTSERCFRRFWCLIAVATFVILTYVIHDSSPTYDDGVTRNEIYLFPLVAFGTAAVTDSITALLCKSETRCDRHASDVCSRIPQGGLPVGIVCIAIDMLLLRQRILLIPVAIHVCAMITYLTLYTETTMVLVDWAGEPCTASSYP